MNEHPDIKLLRGMISDEYIEKYGMVGDTYPKGEGWFVFKSPCADADVEISKGKVWESSNDGIMFSIHNARSDRADHLLKTFANSKIIKDKSRYDRWSITFDLADPNCSDKIKDCIDGLMDWKKNGRKIEK